MSTDTVIDKRGHGFFVIDNALIDRHGPEIGAYAIAVYVTLVRHADENGAAWPSRKRVASLLKCSPDTVDRAIRALIESGLITKTARVSESGDADTNAYTLLKVEGGRSQRLRGRSQRRGVAAHSGEGGRSQRLKEDPVNKTQVNQARQRRSAPVLADAVAPEPTAVHVAAHAATAAPAAPPKRKRTSRAESQLDREPTEHQRYFEAAARACGFDLALMAESDRANVGKLAGKLRADPDVDLALIADAAARWALRFPGKRPADVAPPSVAQLTTWIGRCKLQRAGRRGLQHGAGSSIPSGWTFTGPDGRPRLKGFAVLQVEGHVPREADPLDPETWPPAYVAARAAMEGAA